MTGSLLIGQGAKLLSFLIALEYWERYAKTNNFSYKTCHQIKRIFCCLWTKKIQITITKIWKNVLNQISVYTQIRFIIYGQNLIKVQKSHEIMFYSNDVRSRVNSLVDLIDFSYFCCFYPTAPYKIQ